MRWHGRGALAIAVAWTTACGGASDPAHDGGIENQAPTATSASLTTYMHTPMIGQLEGQDRDGDDLSYAITVEPTLGTVELADDGSFTYVPDDKAFGSDQIAFVVDDGELSSAEATIDIDVQTLTDGTPDGEFGSTGVVAVDFGDIDAFGGVMVQGDGRIVAVGNTASTRFLIAGFTATGAFDGDFADGGQATPDPSLGYDGLGDIVAQSTGRLIAAGQVQGGDRDFVGYGLDPAGDPDATFGSGALAVSDISGVDEDDLVNSLVALPDDRLILAGYASDGVDDDYALARYTADGDIDSDFGEGGSVVIDFAGGDDRINDVVVDGSGNILVVGSVEDGTPNVGLLRLTADGEIDTSFADQGWLVVDLGAYEEGTTVVLGRDGSIYIAGYIEAGDVGSMAVFKATAAGQLDTEFGQGGVATVTSDAFANSYPADMVMLPNQTLVLAGSAQSGGTIAVVARMDLTGQLDPTFAEDGIYAESLGTGGSDFIFALAVQDDGKLVAAGWTDNDDLDALLLRLAW